MLSIVRPLRRRSSFLYALLGAGVLAAIALILDGLFGGTGSEIPAWRRAIVVAALWLLTLDSTEAAVIEAERRADIRGRLQLAAAQAAFWFVFMFVMVGGGAPLVDLGVWLGGGLIFGALLCAVPPRIAPEALDLIRADFQQPDVAPPRYLAVLSPLLPLLGAVLAAWVLASEGNRLNAVLPLTLFAGLAPLHTPLRWRMALRLIGVGLLVLGTVV